MLTKVIDGRTVECTPDEEEKILKDWARKDPASLDNVKRRKTEELKRAYQKALASGFDSNALGTLHRYDSDIASQVKLTSAVASQESVMYECRDANGDSVTAHTAAQMLQVLKDGKRQAEAYRVRLFNRLAAVKNATTTAEAEAVSW